MSWHILDPDADFLTVSDDPELLEGLTVLSKCNHSERADEFQFSGMTPKSDFAKVASHRGHMARFPPSLLSLTPSDDFAEVAAHKNAKQGLDTLPVLTRHRTSCPNKHRDGRSQFMM